MTDGVQTLPDDQVPVLRGGANFRARVSPALVTIDDVADPILTATQLFVQYTRTDFEPLTLPVPAKDGLVLHIVNACGDTMDLQADTEIIFNGTAGLTDFLTVDTDANITFRSLGGIWIIEGIYTGPITNISAPNIVATTSLKVGNSGSKINRLKQHSFSAVNFGSLVPGATQDISKSATSNSDELFVMLPPPDIEAGIIVLCLADGDDNVILRAINCSTEIIDPASRTYTFLGIRFPSE